jgi:hypothetical protein
MAKNKAAIASAYAQVFLYSYLFNDLTEKLTGRRVAFDPVGVVKNAIGDYNNDNLSKGQATFNTTKNISAQLPFASMFTGGRYPIEAGLPSIQNIYDKRKSSSGMWKQAGKEMLKPATYLLPPTGGGAIKKVLQTANDFGLNPLSPQPATGVYQTDSKGNKVMQYPIKNNPLKTLQELSLGRSSLNETRDYFNNNRRALTPKQTRQLEGSSQPLQDYQNLQQQRRIDTIAKKLKSLNKENLPQSERIKKFKDLTDQLKKIREGK